MSKEEFIPTWLAWEVTGRCNLNCIHCRASSSMTSHDTDFTTAEARKLIDDITSFCSPVLVLSGGEPLLRPDLFEIAKYGTDKGLRMCIATNGTLVTDDVCAKMKESGIRITSYNVCYTKLLRRPMLPSVDCPLIWSGCTFATARGR